MTQLPPLPSLAATMTPFPYSLDVDATLTQAAALMAQHQVHHLPVTRDGHTHGILDAPDLQLAVRLSASDTRVGEVCHHPAYTVDIHAPLAEVVREIGQRGITAAVVERKGKLAGILTHTDIARAFGKLLQQCSGSELPPRPA